MMKVVDSGVVIVPLCFGAGTTLFSRILADAVGVWHVCHNYGENLFQINGLHCFSRNRCIY